MIELNDIIENGLQVENKNSFLSPYMIEHVTFLEGKNNHFIDIEKIKKSLEDVLSFLEKKDDLLPLFLFCRKTTQKALETLEIEPLKYNIMLRWMNGLLTNFNNLSSNISFFHENKDGKLNIKTKNKIKKLSNYFSSVNLKKLPNVLICSDVRFAYPAILEAKKMNITVIALVDSSSDVRLIDYPIFCHQKNVACVSFVIKKIMQRIDSINIEEEEEK